MYVNICNYGLNSTFTARTFHWCLFSEHWFEPWFWAARGLELGGLGLRLGLNDAIT